MNPPKWPKCLELKKKIIKEDNKKWKEIYRYIYTYSSKNFSSNLYSLLLLLQLFYGFLDFVWDYPGEPVAER